MNPLRILHLNTEKGFRGGERQVLLLARGLRERGHEQMFVGLRDGEFARALHEEKFDIHEYRRRKMLGPRSPSLARWLRILANGFKPDIVHAHTGNAHTMAVSAFLGKVPIVVTRRVDFPVAGNLWSRRKYAAPGQRFIAISEGIRRVLIEGGVPADRIDLVYSGVDVARVAAGDGTGPRREWLGDAGGPLIGFVGALVDHKAPWVLARAALHIHRVLPGARCVFVGDGELRPRLEEIAAERPGAIIFAGWRDDIADVYAALDIFVMPSKLEGLCTALIDALAAGVPAIASRAGGMPEVVVDRETGELIPPEDDHALATRIIELWHAPDTRKKYSEEGKRRVQKLFTAEAMVEGNLGAYGKMMNDER